MPIAYLQGYAIAIADGDTFTLDTRQQRLKIRLSEIDTPELNQPYGIQARQLLKQWIGGKSVRIRPEGIDKYGRTIGRVYLKEGWLWGYIDINAQLVEYGAAWVYRQYSTDPVLLRLEQTAKAEKRGIWGLPLDQQMPPWVFRHSGSEMLSDSQRMAGCQPKKRLCRDMIDCAEAQFYFNVCSLGKLDQDGDNIPCESLCH